MIGNEAPTGAFCGNSPFKRETSHFRKSFTVSVLLAGNVTIFEPLEVQERTNPAKETPHN
jgi:hypothetical protein